MLNEYLPVVDAVAPSCICAMGVDMGQSSNNFGRWLKNKRESMNMSPEELADRAETSRPTISRYENGKGGVPRESTVKRIARALSPDNDDRFLDEARTANAADMLPSDVVTQKVTEREETIISVTLGPHTATDPRIHQIALDAARRAAQDTYYNTIRVVREVAQPYMTEAELDALVPLMNEDDIEDVEELVPGVPSIMNKSKVSPPVKAD